MTQILCTGSHLKTYLGLASALAIADKQPGQVLIFRDEMSPYPPDQPTSPEEECKVCLPWDACTCDGLTDQARVQVGKAEEKRVRKNLKRLLAQKRDVIHRCGWCGFPVQEDGSFIPGIDFSNADQYLKLNASAEENLVNGECCPNGDQFVNGECCPNGDQ